MDNVNFRISEANYNRLESAKKQLGLVTGLLSEKTGDLGCFDADELYYFLDAQHRTLKGIIDDIDTYHDAQRVESANVEGSMMPIEMLGDVIDSCSGVAVAEEKIIAITEKLTDWAMVDICSGKVAKAYFAALRRAGWDVIQTIKNGHATFSYSLRPDAV